MIKYQDLTIDQLDSLLYSLKQKQEQAFKNGEIWSHLIFSDEIDIVSIHKTIKHAEMLMHSSYRRLPVLESLTPIPDEAKRDFEKFLKDFDLTVTQGVGWIVDLCGRTIGVNTNDGSGSALTLDQWRTGAVAAKRALEEKWR